MEDVPVLRAVASFAVVLLFLEPLEGPSVEEGARLSLRERADVFVRRPGVAITQKLAREPAARHDRAADPRPDVGEPGRVAEEHAEARPHEVRRRPLDVFHRRYERLQTQLELRPDPGAAPLE